MNDTQNEIGEIQAENAIQAIQFAGGHKVSKEDELALRQMISGIIPERQNIDDKKRGAIVKMTLWTGELMNWARTHMKTWMEKKNEHKASYRQDGHVYLEGGKGTEFEEAVGGEKEKTYGIKHWGK
eukprot:6204671-Pleurochrysis_carterae.AAC.1